MQLLRYGTNHSAACQEKRARQAVGPQHFRFAPPALLPARRALQLGERGPTPRLPAQRALQLGERDLCLRPGGPSGPEGFAIAAPLASSIGRQLVRPAVILEVAIIARPQNRRGDRPQASLHATRIASSFSSSSLRPSPIAHRVLSQGEAPNRKSAIENRECQCCALASGAPAPLP
jgi:hypothetical protein